MKDIRNLLKEEGKIAQWIKAMTVKSNDLSHTTRMTGRKNQL